MTSQETASKADLRKQAFAARKAAFAERAATGAVAAATAHLLAEIGPSADQVIAAYMPIRTELDPIPAMTALYETGAKIAVPVIRGTGEPLDFRHWSPDAEMVDGPFGAKVPATGEWLDPSVVVVPLVGFDAACNRLGYGGGFYDRTLELLSARGPVRAIGFAFAAQELPGLSVEPTDYRLDAIVTEAGVVRP